MEMRNEIKKNHGTLPFPEEEKKPSEQNRVREEAVSCGAKRQDRYTVEDYLRLPDERRAELIDGVFYDMTAPSVPHQQLVLEFSVILRNYIRKQGGHCMVLPSPVDVQLDCDDYTMVQPDVVVCCDPAKIHKERIFGGACRIDMAEISAALV